jgi:precorrin-6B methylase 2
MCKLFFRLSKELRAISKEYKISKRQYWIYYFVRYAIGKVFSDRIGLGEFILYHKKTGKKLYFSNLGYVYEQLESVYETNPRLKLAKGKNIVDIGAACGEYSLKAAMQGCNVIACEPDQRRYRYLVGNLRELDNVTLLNKAVGLREECISLDKITEKLDKIDILKIDVDGDEFNVLVSGEESVSKSKNIIMECDYSHIKEKCTAFLKKRGFNLDIKGNLVFAFRKQ